MKKEDIIGLAFFVCAVVVLVVVILISPLSEIK